MIRVHYIDAPFAGETVRFELKRDRHSMASLVAAIGSPHAAFQRFAGGQWLPEDVRMILAHAYPGAKLRHKLTRVMEIDEAFEGAPVNTFAALAGQILVALMAGREIAGDAFGDAPHV